MNEMLNAVKGQSPVIVALLIMLGYLYYEGVQARGERAQIRDEVSQLVDKCVMK